MFGLTLLQILLCIVPVGCLVVGVWLILKVFRKNNDISLGSVQILDFSDDDRPVYLNLFFDNGEISTTLFPSGSAVPLNTLLKLVFPGYNVRLFKGLEDNFEVNAEIQATNIEDRS